MNLDGQHPERGVAGRLGDALRAGRRDLDAAAGHDGLAGHVPPPVGAGQARRRPPTTSPAAASSSASAPAGTSASTRPTASRSRPCGPGWTCSRSSSRSSSATGADGAVLLRRRALPARGPGRPAQAGPAAPPAADHGRQRRPAQRRGWRPATPTSTTPRSRRRARCSSAATGSSGRASEAGREPIPFSIMTGVLVGADEPELARPRPPAGREDGRRRRQPRPRARRRAGSSAPSTRRPSSCARCATPGSAASCASSCCTTTSTRWRCSASGWRRRWPEPTGWRTARSARRGATRRGRRGPVRPGRRGVARRGVARHGAASARRGVARRGGISARAASDSPRSCRSRQTWSPQGRVAQSA